jgi:hypothetical protein
VTRYEISQTLKRNLEKPVRIVYASGDVKRVVPISIDHLGFVYDAEVGESSESFFAPSKRSYPKATCRSRGQE